MFDGRQLQPPGTVVIDGARIGTDPAGAEVIDGDGGVLLPGLIDAHVHLTDRDTLGRRAVAGVTTALDMACGPPALVDSLRGVAGLTDIRSAGTPAIAPGSLHARFPVIGARGAGTSPGADQAAGFAAARVAEGSDYIKIVVGSPGADHDQATLDALAAAAREHGLVRARPTPRRTRPRRRRSEPGSACSPTCRWTGRWTRPRRRAPGPTTAS